MTAKYSMDRSELSVFNDLNRTDFPVERSTHIVTLLNSFNFTVRTANMAA